MIRSRFTGDATTTSGRPRAAVAAGPAPIHRRLHSALLVLLLVLVTAVSAVTTARPAEAATLPTGFQETTVISGLTNPTVVRFSSDGRVFVAEKRGVIKVFDSLTDT